MTANVTWYGTIYPADKKQKIAPGDLSSLRKSGIDIGFQIENTFGYYVRVTKEAYALIENIDKAVIELDLYPVHEAAQDMVPISEMTKEQLQGARARFRFIENSDQSAHSPHDVLDYESLRTIERQLYLVTNELVGRIGKHDWYLATPIEDGILIHVDDRPITYRKSIQEARDFAKEFIARIVADGDYFLSDKPQGFSPPLLPSSESPFHRNEKALREVYDLRAFGGTPHLPGQRATQDEFAAIKPGIDF